MLKQSRKVLAQAEPLTVLAEAQPKKSRDPSGSRKLSSVRALFNFERNACNRFDNKLTMTPLCLGGATYTNTSA